MRQIGCLAGLLLLVAIAAGSWFVQNWFISSQVEEDSTFIVARNSTLTSVAGELEEQGFIASSGRFLAQAKLFGGADPIQAGEFLLPIGASGSDILSAMQNGEIVRRFVTIPEGMPSVLVHERLMAQVLLSGEVEIPREGSILPQTYDFARGESREALVARMQAAMDEALAKAWAARSPNTAVKTPQEALSLAAIVEKETGVPEERRMVAGLYSNRLRQGIMLQADPTIIYPITRGKPLGRRIRQSEISSVNDYNTYSMLGLPKGPITNPGLESIEAVLNPAETSALFMVADGSGGHAFADTNAEHNENVAEWYALQEARGER